MSAIEPVFSRVRNAQSWKDSSTIIPELHLRFYYYHKAFNGNKNRFFFVLKKKSTEMLKKTVNVWKQTSLVI